MKVVQVKIMVQMALVRMVSQKHQLMCILLFIVTPIIRRCFCRVVRVFNVIIVVHMLLRSLESVRMWETWETHREAVLWLEMKERIKAVRGLLILNRHAQVFHA